MRSAVIVCVCLLTACSTQSVRCDRHLTPINVPQRPIAGIGAAGPPHDTRQANAVAPSVRRSGAASRPAAAREGSP